MTQASHSKHSSLEKTQAIHLGTTEDSSARRPTDEVSDLDLLRETLFRKCTEFDAAQRHVQELKVAFAALQNDFSGEKAEHLAELKTLQDILRRANADNVEQQASLKEARKVSRELKSQNLDLQHRLGQWGIPLPAGALRLPADAVPGMEEGFFPPLQPVEGSADPVPADLRGDLSTIDFPDLLHFLARPQRTGVVTVLCDAILSKLFIEQGVLQYAGWNNPDPELSLAKLLVDSGLVPKGVLDELRGRARFDLELAATLVDEKKIPVDVVRTGLHEHAKVILGYLFHLKSGTFFFQRGVIERKAGLEFRQSIVDILLKTAAEVDEKSHSSPPPERV